MGGGGGIFGRRGGRNGGRRLEGDSILKGRVKRLLKLEEEEEEEGSLERDRTMTLIRFLVGC